MLNEKRPSKIRSFRDLEIWKRGINLVEDIYEITKPFPKEEKYGLISQMRRAAVSVPSNIAEGFGRFHSKEYRQFLHISLGSCAELITHIVIAERLKYISKRISDELSQEVSEISKMIMCLIKKL